MKISKKMQKILLATIFAVGLGIFLYPILSNLYVGYFQNQVIDSYQDKIEQMTEQEKRQELAEMMRYNDKLNQTGIEYVDPFEGILDNDTDSGADESEIAVSIDEEPDIYDALSDSVGEALGHIEIPKIDIDIPIYFGTSEKVLQEGIGLLEGSSLPVGGTSTHATLTGHNGLPSAKLFTDLHELAVGDVFLIHSINGTLAYEVDTIITVLPDETDSLKIVEGEDLVTLITCTPYMINTHRLLVTGHRVDYEEVEEISKETQVTDPVKDVKEQDNKIIYFVVAMAFILLMVTIMLYRRRRKKEGGQNEK
ncbi:class C sortase [Trichococcus sp.]|uniref:class C sortase n=1 Tax=Trichococcus sp. TaxID=1985464 RepID=UPI003C7E8B4E